MSFRWLASRRRRAIISLVFGLAAVFLGGMQVIRADSSLSFDATITYQVESSGSTRVIEDYKVGASGSNKYLDSLTLSTPVDDTTNVAAVYSDGVRIPVTVTSKTSTDQGYNSSYKEVFLKFPRKNTGNTSWEFRLVYDTAKLVDSKGIAHTVHIPAIAPTSQKNGTYRAIVTVPQDFGAPHSSGALPTSEGNANGRSVYSFTQQDISKQSIALTFGDQTVYKVNFNYPLDNESRFTRTMTVTLPPDTSSQKIYINSLNPKPKATRLDADGNVLADFDVPARTKLVVKTDISAAVSYLEYDLSSGGTKADLPTSLVNRYTGATHFWQSLDPNIVAKANQATAGTTKVADQIKALQTLVVDTLTYNDAKIKYNIRQGATKALSNPTNAVCLEYSDLMVALLRSQGIPARMPVGYAYTGDLKASREVSDSLHSWVEAYVPKVGWINVDPTWGEKYDNFGKSDLDHFAFALWGTTDSSPTAVMAGNADQNYQYEQTKISYAGELPKPRLTSKVVAKRWVVLPFVSVVSYTVSGPDGVAGDNYELVIKGATDQKIDLGSLAPSQKVSDFLPLLGTSYLAATTLSFKQAGAVPTSLSSVSVTDDYRPMLAIILLVFVVVGVVLVRLMSRKRRDNTKPPAQTLPTGGGQPSPKDDPELVKKAKDETTQQPK